MKYAGIHVPAGCDVLIGDSEASLSSVGVLPEDGETTIGINYDSVEVKGSKNEDVMRYIKNMSAEAKFTIYQILLDNIATFSKGMMSVDSLAGTLVSGGIQTIPGGWEELRFYKLTGQNADKSRPSITSVKAGTTTLGEDDDYFIVKGQDGEWGIYLDTSGSSTFDESKVITVTSDYTPVKQKVARMGAPSVEIQPQVVRFLKTQGGKKFQITLWSATNSNGLTFSFPSANTDKPASMDITLKGGLDSSRTEGEQLVEIIDEIGIVA